MAFSLVAYSQSIDEGGVLTEIDPASDVIVSISGKNIFVPLLNRLLGVWVGLGSTGVQAYLDAPSLRRLILQDVSPLELALAPSDVPALSWYGANPIALETNEGLKLLTQADPATAERRIGLVWLGDAGLVPVGGDIRTIRATSAITATVGAWTNGPMTFRQTLPVGTYRVVGASVIGANICGFRFVPIGVAQRPGGLGQPTADAKVAQGQRFGGWGAWFDFHSTTPPTLDILTSGASSSQIIYIDLIKVG